MSVRRIALVVSLAAASLSLTASPMMAATPDVGYRVTRSDVATPVGSVEVSPWVWEPESSDALRIAVGTRTRRIIIRTWRVAGIRHGRFVEQARGAVNRRWTTVSRTPLSEADLAGGSTLPDRLSYKRAGFLAFDAASMSIEDHGGLAYSIVTAAGRPLIIRFGAHDRQTAHWITVTRIVNR
jgi:hypothetical protein